MAKGHHAFHLLDARFIASPLAMRVRSMSPKALTKGAF